MHFNHCIIIMGKERTNKHIKKRRQEKAAVARGEKNALRKFNKISKLQKLRNNNNNSITSIDPNLQPMSVDNKTDNNNLAELHGSGSGQVMSTHQQRVEQQRRIRSSKVANVPYCVLPQPYNVCRRTTNMNALQMHNYIETLRGEYAAGRKKFERERTFENRSKCSRTFGFSSTNK